MLSRSMPCLSDVLLPYKMIKLLFWLVILLFITKSSLCYSVRAGVGKRAVDRSFFRLEAGFGKPKVTTLDKVDNTPQPNTPCACDSGKVYEECCKPVHDGLHLNLNPVQVIRGRFSALCYGVVPFLVKSTHPDAKDYVGEDEGSEKFRSKKTKRTIWEKEVSQAILSLR